MTTDLLQSTILQRPSRSITFTEAMHSGQLIVDVRSPQEYLEGSLPEAVNIPVFNNEERSTIGLIYRHGGQDKAVEKGFELVQARIDALLHSFTPFRQQSLAIYCARGGMRSQSIVNLLCQNGYQAHQITGGYRAYRHALLAALESFSPPLIVLHGHTGTGKTRILQQLPDAIDLEDLAQHQSSLFGGLHRTPRTQKNFDSLLYNTLLHLRQAPFFIEGESRQMGNIFLPVGLANAMKKGHLVLVTASLETRIRRILEDYPVTDEPTRQQVRKILQALRHKVGNALVDKLCLLLNRGELAELVAILLTEYYDRRYAHSFRKHTYDFRLSSEDIVDAARQLMDFKATLVR